MYFTIEDRKRRQAERRARAVETICDELAAFAREHGGRFILYGSAARGMMRYDSDIDLFLDVPDAAEPDAWRLAERLAAHHDIAADIQPVAWCDPAFVAKILPGARVIS